MFIEVQGCVNVIMSESSAGATRDKRVRDSALLRVNKLEVCSRSGWQDSKWFGPDKAEQEHQALRLVLIDYAGHADCCQQQLSIEHRPGLSRYR